MRGPTPRCGRHLHEPGWMTSAHYTDSPLTCGIYFLIYMDQAEHAPCSGTGVVVLVPHCARNGCCAGTRRCRPLKQCCDLHSLFGFGPAARERAKIMFRSTPRLPGNARSARSGGARRLLSRRFHASHDLQDLIQGLPRVPVRAGSDPPGPSCEPDSHPGLVGRPALKNFHHLGWDGGRRCLGHRSPSLMVSPRPDRQSVDQ